MGLLYLDSGGWGGQGRPPARCLAALFPTAPLQTARESFDLKQLSSDLCQNMASPWSFRCSASWHARQVTRVLRRYATIRWTHRVSPCGLVCAGRQACGCDALHMAPAHRRVTRLCQEPLHDFTATSVDLLGCSLRMPWRCQRRAMPPNRAISGVWPSPRLWCTSSTFNGPCGVATVARYL